MNKSQALMAARLDTHIVSGVLFEGQFYSSNKQANIARTRRIVMRAVAYHYDSDDYSLIGYLTEEGLNSGITKQSELFDWVSSHYALHVGNEDLL